MPRKDEAILDSWASPAPQHLPLAAHRTHYHEPQHFSSPMASTASLISSQIFTSGRVKVSVLLILIYMHNVSRGEIENDAGADAEIEGYAITAN